MQFRLLLVYGVCGDDFLCSRLQVSGQCGFQSGMKPFPRGFSSTRFSSADVCRLRDAGTRHTGHEDATHRARGHDTREERGLAGEEFGGKFGGGGAV